MKISEIFFIIIILLNTILGILYLVWGIMMHEINEKGENERISYILRAVCILVCPVVALVFLAIGTLIEKLFFKNSVNLTALLFAKDRVEQLVKADEEREKNMASMEEALCVSDHGNLRTLTMNVIRGDVEKSLSAIAKALDCEDTETSHYAAAVLSKALNDFRINVKKIEQRIDQLEEENPDDFSEHDRLCVMLLDYMDSILRQSVLTGIEQEYFVREMAYIGEKICDSDAMSAELYSEIAQRLMEIGDFERADIWCDRAYVRFPKALSSYRCKLKLLYLKNDRDGFLGLLKNLKESGIAMDNENMEMIRMFQ